MPKPEKTKKVEELKEMLKDAKGLYFADFTGLTVPEITELRRRMKEKNVVFKVIKNTLMRIALDELGYTEIKEMVVGPNAIVVSYEDPIESIKILYNFRKEFEKGDVKVGYIEGMVLGKEDLEKLAKLPGKDELRAKVVGALSGPLYMLVLSLNGLLNKLVWTLEAIKKAKEEGK